MIKKKDIVLQYLERIYSENQLGYSTIELSEHLGISRNNLSTLLNELVEEGKIEKSHGRPVLYRLISKESNEDDCFSSLIGFDGSLKKAIQAAKAASAYPETSLPIMIFAEKGSGSSVFSDAIIQYVQNRKGIEKLIRFDTRYFKENPDTDMKALFVDDGERNSYFEKSKEGILYISHGDLLSFNAKSWIIDNLEHELFVKQNTFLICSGSKKEDMEELSSKFPVVIELPSLAQRPMKERIDLINLFVSEEANKAGKNIVLSKESYRCLLLYRCEGNVRQLKNDIKTACANAYVRQYSSSSDSIFVYMTDFSQEVRRGILWYKNRDKEIDEIVSGFVNRSFSEIDENIKKSTHNRDSVYSIIEEKNDILKEGGLSEDDIQKIINRDIQSDLQKYNQFVEKDIDFNSIRKVVDPKIVDLVETFLKDASTRFRRSYQTSTFFGLCLHVEGMNRNVERKQVLTKDKILEIANTYQDEYEYATSFVKKLEEGFGRKISIDETVFITMFILQNDERKRENKHPKVLIAMHGDSTAKSMSNVVNFLLQSDEVFSFDLNLDMDLDLAFQNLKEMMQNIDDGSGILLLYDMGSLKTMAEMISQECGIALRCIELPSTLVALDFARKLQDVSKLDDIYDSLLVSFRKNYYMIQESYERYHMDKAIITLCMSGQGGAQLIKDYIEKNVQLSNCDVIPLAISDRSKLIRQINEIQKDKEILCVVGSYDPKIIGMRYIPMNSVINVEGNRLNMLLQAEGLIAENEKVNYELIFENLKESIPNLNLKRMQKLLPKAVSQLKEKHYLDADQVVGLTMHIACAIDRIKGKKKLQSYPKENKIISSNKRMYYDLKDVLNDLEKAYRFRFPDSEIAYIIALIKRL